MRAILDELVDDIPKGIGVLARIFKMPLTEASDSQQIADLGAATIASDLHKRDPVWSFAGCYLKVFPPIPSG